MKNSVTETVKINGDCGMCKVTIDDVGSKKRESKVDWDENAHLASITYDPTRTNKEEVLKRIALAGYDNESYRACDEAYMALPGCCQYKREHVSPAPGEAKINTTDHTDMGHVMKEEVEHVMDMSIPGETEQVSDLLQTQVVTVAALKKVIEDYFKVKDALVASDKVKTTAVATAMLAKVKLVKMEELSAEVKKVWTEVRLDIEKSLGDIVRGANLAMQRAHFIALTEEVYTLQKAIGTDVPLYYQFCPMANDGKGANWLSKEKVIENPYYGEMMLSCGKTVETIEK